MAEIKFTKVNRSRYEITADGKYLCRVTGRDTAVRTQALFREFESERECYGVREALWKYTSMNEVYFNTDIYAGLYKLARMK
jgi:hypothetical protein